MAVTEIQNRFDGGMSSDPFATSANEFAESKNLDIFTQLGRIRPYRGLEALDSGHSGIRAITRGSDNELYGLDDINKKLYKLSGTTWNNIQNTAGNISLPFTPGFVEHQGFLYWYGNYATVGTASVVSIDRYELQTGTYTNEWARITIGGTSGTNLLGPGEPAFIHRSGLNDRLYFGIANGVYELDRFNDLQWDNSVNPPTPQTPPGYEPSLGFVGSENYHMVSATDWDRYVVFAMNHKGGAENSIVLFWDGYSVRANFLKVIPEGKIHAIRNIGGQVVAICSQKDVDSKLYIYTFAGGEFQLAKSLIKRNAPGNITFHNSACDVKNNSVFFGGEFAGDVGIYRYGISKAGSPYLVLDRTATTSNTESSIENIYIENDTVYAVYNNGNITRTKGSADYNLNDVSITTRRFYADQILKKKKWQAVTVSILPNLENYTPSFGSISLSYRVDDDTNFTTIGTMSNNDLTKEFTFENTGVTIEGYRSIQFKLDISGLMQVTEIKVRHEILPQTYE